ncbi:MAG: hypothetical protein NZ773_08250, partial [Dehalococcoidia bacterium]|nr:hypothetical protein [Dehalococcoidia bacterium]
MNARVYLYASRIERALSGTVAQQDSLPNETGKQTRRLVWADPAQLCRLPAGNLSVSFDVLHQHLLLLDRRKAALTDIAGRVPQPRVESRGKVVRPTFPLTARLSKAALDEALEDSSRLGFVLVDERGGSRAPDDAVAPERIQRGSSNGPAARRAQAQAARRFATARTCLQLPRM